MKSGEEETKGNELTREAHRLLKAAPIDFIGNVEAMESRPMRGFGCPERNLPSAARAATTVAPV